MTNDEHDIGGWRGAVRAAMRRAADDEALESYGTVEPSFNYRWEHVRAVAALADRLGRMLKADLEVLEASAWLHDVAKSAGEDHPQQGAAFARDLLERTDFPPPKIALVAQVIEVHKGLWRDEPLSNLEAMILWDADKLSKIGLTAAFHWTGMALASEEPMSTEDLIASGRRADWQSRTVASMHTAPARRAAEQRIRAYGQLWDQLEAELRGDDLSLDG